MISADDPIFMRRALELAREAAAAGEIPVGAVAVFNGTVIAGARNRVEEMHSATAHAELLLIRAIEAQRRDWRMTGVTVYVTKEPCPMCAGLLVNARVERIVFGASDPAFGACGGAVCIPELPRALWHPAVDSGVLAEESVALLREFFRARREAKNSAPAEDFR